MELAKQAGDSMAKGNEFNCFSPRKGIKERLEAWWHTRGTPLRNRAELEERIKTGIDLVIDVLTKKEDGTEIDSAMAEKLLSEMKAAFESAGLPVPELLERLSCKPLPNKDLKKRPPRKKVAQESKWC